MIKPEIQWHGWNDNSCWSFLPWRVRLACTLALLLCIAAPQITFAETTGQDQSLKNIQSALQQKDLKAFKGLFYWEGVSQQSKATLHRFLFSKLFDREITAVRFQPLPEGFRSEYILNGVRTYMNIQPLGYVKIEYQPGQHGRSDTSLPYGKKGDRYYFAGSVEETLRTNAPRSRQIQVNIFGTISPDPVKFEGHMIYTQNEKPLRDEIKDMGSGNLTRVVRGEDIIYLEVRRTSKTGKIKVIISIDGKTIFETDYHESDQPIIFKK